MVEEEERRNEKADGEDDPVLYPENALCEAERR